MLRTTFLTVIVLLTAMASAFAHLDAAQSAKPTTAIKEQTPWGIAGDARLAVKTVEIRMVDTMRFRPDRLTVRVGDTIRFVMHNDGKLMHELVLGTKATLEEHSAAMRRFPNMEHDAPYMAHVAPGKRGEIVWKFNRTGEFGFACLIAGHYESGMVGKVIVRAN
jgi:uncharacterized cupredoxin-like copper-binding protein